MKELNCPNCGAPITDYKCHYCGTLFYDFTNLEIGKVAYIRIRFDGDKVCIFKTVPVSMSVDCRWNETPEISMDFHVFEMKHDKGGE